MHITSLPVVAQLLQSGCLRGCCQFKSSVCPGNEPADQGSLSRVVATNGGSEPALFVLRMNDRVKHKMESGPEWPMGQKREKLKNEYSSNDLKIE